MFRIAEDPSSGRLVQCLAKNYSNDSIVSVDMDKVGVMAAYSEPLCMRARACVRVSIDRIILVIYPSTVQGSLMMDPLRSATCWSTFRYFKILIVSTYYLLCIGWIMKCLIIIDARCKHAVC